jgi:hypothetical protein
MEHGISPRGKVIEGFLSSDGCLETVTKRSFAERRQVLSTVANLRKSRPLPPRAAGEGVQELDRTCPRLFPVFCRRIRRRSSAMHQGRILAVEHLHLPHKAAIFSAVFSCHSDGLSLPGWLCERRWRQINYGGKEKQENVLMKIRESTYIAELQGFQHVGLTHEDASEKPPPPYLILHIVCTLRPFQGRPPLERSNKPAPKNRCTRRQGSTAVRAGP